MKEKHAGAKLRGGSKRVSKTFRATLERMRGNLGWTIVWIPFSVHKTWGARGNFRIKGEINGFAFRTSLFPTRKGIHFLLVNKRMQRGADVAPGSTAQFVLQPDTAERVAVVPAELQPFLAEDKSFRRWFEALSYSYRKWFCDSITQVKSPASRQRRAEQIAEQLFSAMEAERELPPALKLAFSNEPRAMEGWNLMSPNQRRAQLIAIFHYCSPDARARRLAKVLEAAAAFAEKKSAT
ncbi:MAG TPA: YdeI/OmpD-associated family protein [Candidatus Methylomirabilis sp.]|nr:YdeI/OmpD-associated family protein [Candidatus Methylomirabilis sp.]